MKKTIETKIATNGVKLYYVDGKRTSREVALQATADSRENLFTIEYATRHTSYFTGRILDATQVYESTSKAVLKELELKIDEYHGFAVKLHTIGWVEICKLFNKDYAKSLINKIENAFIRGEYGVKIDKYGKVSILSAPVVEPEPDDYAVNPDAFDIAVNAEIQAANTAKINDLKWEIRYTEGSINDLDQNHIANAPSDQSLKERRTELVNELAALNSQLADLLPAEIQAANNEQNDEAIEAEFTAAQNEVHRLQDEMKSLIGTPDYFVTKNEYHAAWQRYELALAKAQQASRRRMAALLNNEPATEPDEPKFQTGNLIADHTTGLKEEQPMTDKLIISTKENADGKITAYYLNGKKTRKAEIEYCYANNPAYDGIIQTDYYTAKYQFPNLYYGHGCRYFIMTLDEETLMSKAAADLLGYQIGRPFARGIYHVTKLDQTIPDDDGSNDEEPNLIVETKRTKRDSINLKLNGSRISLASLVERLSNAANENFSVINQYGKEYSCYPANNYGYFGESPEGYTIHFNTLGELIEHYAVDNIIRTAEPADQPTNDPPADNRHDTEEPVDNPTNDTQDTDQLIDPPELPTAKPRTLRNSINRAIKQCIRNRIGYLKSHNSKMEKYEYELLCLLQGARRELEVA